MIQAPVLSDMSVVIISKVIMSEVIISIVIVSNYLQFTNLQ
jgi:hypothetical protein